MNIFLALALIVGAIAGCGKSSGLSREPQELKIETITCKAYHKSIVGWTIQRASYERIMVGGTPGDQQWSKKELDMYGSVWDCQLDVSHDKDSWCECKSPYIRSASNREAELIAFPSVIWIEN